MIETRTVNQRLEALEHDNNLLRERDADRQVEYIRFEQQFNELGAKCEALIQTVNEFVGRFGRVN